MPTRPPSDLRVLASQQIADASPGTVLRQALDSQGVTVTAAAKRLGTSQPTLSLMLADKREISKAMAIRIEEAFGIPGYVIARLRFEADWQQEHESSKRAAEQA